MTIRDYIERRRNRACFATVGGLMTVSIEAYLNEPHRIGIPSQLVIVGFFAVAIIGVLMKQRAACAWTRRSASRDSPPTQ